MENVIIFLLGVAVGLIPGQRKKWSRRQRMNKQVDKLMKPRHLCHPCNAMGIEDLIDE